MKRGISPLIASVLIIGFTVALAVVMITWGGKFIQDQVDTADEQGELNTAFGEFDMRLKVANIDFGNLTITVENSGAMVVEEIIVRNGESTYNLDLSATPQGELNPLEIKTYVVTVIGSSGSNKVEVIPGADLNNDGEIDFIAAKLDEAPLEYLNFRVFVSSAIGTGDFSTWVQTNNDGLIGGDEICQSLADDPGVNLGGTWKAWLSDATTSASDRLHHTSVPYMLIDGTTLIANDWSDLIDGSILSNAISKHEDGTVPVDPTTYTGTNIDGTIVTNAHCVSWTDTAGSVAIGFSSTPFTPAWTNIFPISCTNPGRIYCFEQPIF